MTAPMHNTEQRIRQGCKVEARSVGLPFGLLGPAGPRRAPGSRSSSEVCALKCQNDAARRLRSSVSVALLWLGCMGWLGCSATAEEPFDSHTRRSFGSEADLASYCAVAQGKTACKFIATRFPGLAGTTELLDPQFYRLHDEWYWFHLLNGRSLDGVADEPDTSRRYSTIAQIYTAFAGKTKLPLDLAFYGDRLYSPRFYELMLGKLGPEGFSGAGRILGGGTLQHWPAEQTRPWPNALWTVALEVSEKANEALLLAYFARLNKVLPKQVAGNVYWLSRGNPQQDALVAQLRAGSGPLAKRVLYQTDLVAPGQVEGYTEGITAGRLRKLSSGQLGSATFDRRDLLLLPTVPDELPPVAGVLTAVPQTPQAHLNLLMEARGTPNGFVSGILQDPVLAEWAENRDPVILQVQKGKVRWRKMSQPEWNSWLERTGTAQAKPPAPLPATVPLTVDLSGRQIEEMAGLRPIIGGKCAGMLALLTRSDLHTPLKPLCLTVAGELQHRAAAQAYIDAVLKIPEFDTDRYVRYLLLEGQEQLQAEHPGDANVAKALAWGAQPGLDAKLLELLQAQGLRRWLAKRPIDGVWLQTIRSSLQKQFAGLSVSQGLRFRSSSTAEDIEGFNGAGIYDSETGFLQPPAAEANKTLERAIGRVWASYWLFGAVEERRNAGIDHAWGRMAVLVEPRFDDAKESANVVAVARLSRIAGMQAFVVTLNALHGSGSVTNPLPGQGLPEVVEVQLGAGAAPVIQRIQPATVGGQVLSDAEIVALVAPLRGLAEAWLDAAGQGLAPALRPRTVALDLELKRMLPGWPTLADGSQPPARMVAKQVRPLRRAGHVQPLPGFEVPSDLWAATKLVQRRSCFDSELDLQAIELYSDPALKDEPYAVRPYDASVQVTLTLPVLGIPAGAPRWALPSNASFDHPQMTEKTWDLELTPAATAAQQWGWQQLSVQTNGQWQLRKGSLVHSGGPLKCSTLALTEAPEAWLLQLLDAP